LTVPRRFASDISSDIALAKSVLGWEPRVTLEDGLKETIGYFRKVIA